MTVSAFLRYLADRDIRITRNGDRLQLSAAEGALTDSLRAEIVARKAEILAFLRETPEQHDTEFVLRPAPTGQSLPLSFAQQRLWFLHQLDPDDPVYNLAVSVRLPNPVDVSALTRALEEVARRHDILRTVFREIDGAPSQVVTNILPTLQTIDLTHIADDRRLEEVLRCRDAQVKRRFTLADTPAIHAAIIQVTGELSALVIVVHHILVDGWSLGLLVEQVSERYNTFRAGGLPTPAAMPWQYADYAYSEQAWFETSNQQPNIEYWKQKLSGTLSSLDLPLDRPRGPVLGSRGTTQTFTISPELAEQLRALSRRSGVTLFTTLLAVFKTLLYRYSGQTDILVGTPVANRKHVELESLIGLFVSTLVLRTDLSHDPPFRELLRRVHGGMLDAHEHQDYPFEKLVDLARADRSLSHSPLFQASFNFQNTPRVGTYDTIGGGAVFELSLYFWDMPDTLGGSFEYNTDLFDADTITRMIGHLHTLAEAVVANPDQPISQLPILTLAERVQLLDTWNQTAADYPKDRCVHELFEQQAAATPNAVAVIAPTTEGVEPPIKLTYRELDQRANQVAHHLRSLGVGSESLVAVALDRSVDLVVTVLGVWKAGAAYVPLDPSYPKERLAFMARDAGVVAMVTKTSLEASIPTVNCPIVDLDRDRAAITAQPEAAPKRHATSRQLAYVIYTSGSTGTPKGVLIQHQSVVNFLHAMRQEPGLTAADRLLSVTTLSFDIAGLELYLPLITGACIILASRAVATDGTRLAQQMTDCGVTVMQATPVTWRLLLESGWRDGRGLTVLCGGEALPRNLADDLLATGATLWNLYGPTETTIWSTVRHVGPTRDPVPIGRPIANTTIYILDRRQTPVPINVPGELYIGGDGLARGYHQRPELTAERFVHDPFSPTSGRLYRTGDLARYRADGSIEYLGRLDHQVKLRGFRIELGEIESVLATHPRIEQAVVMAYEATPGDQRLVAYLIGSPTDGIKSTELRAWLSERLPQHMLPSAFVFVDAFPLTPNGKVDRQALLATDVGTQVASSASVPLRSGLESVVAQVWRETLHVDEVWATDNFFELGGNSLLGVRLLSNLEKAVGRRLPVSVLFQGQTVRAMTEALGEDFSEISFLAVPLHRAGSRPPLFIVPGVDGDIIGYDRLARALRSDQPVYGLRSVGLDAEAEPLERMEDIGARFVQEIRHIQPHGPYYLSGLCIGGIVAYEIAQQLMAQGESVDLLILIGTWPPYSIPSTVSTSRFAQEVVFFCKGVARHARTMWQRPPGQRLSYLKEKAGILSEIVAQRDVYRGDSQSLYRDIVVKANQRAASRYVPGPYRSPLVSILTDGIPLSDRDPRLIWRKFAESEFTAVLVPGQDSGVLLKPPYLQGLVEAMTKVLNKRFEATVVETRSS
ncbi:MAG TPA: amino acid adenylation domain-containing protein [Gemmatimonadaceae bacterium]|nr:amino acid adenylation domain-containing protein [Gemmatimonadaceae bacterium]